MSGEVLENSQMTKRSEWFDNFISQLRADELLLETNLADKAKQVVYNAMVEDDYEKIASFTLRTIHKKVTTQLVGLFLNNLFNNLKSNIVNLAFDLSGNEVLVWAVVNDDDENAERSLYLSESYANSNNKNTQFSLSVTVLEESDNIQIPSQYILLNKKAFHA